MAYSILAEGRTQEELDDLDASIGMAEGPEQAAMAALNEYREQMGLEPLPMPDPSGRNGNEEVR